MILDEKDFIFAGKATFTIQNTATEGRKTFSVTKKKTERRSMWFVSILDGHKFKYAGIVYDDNQTKLHHTKKSRFGTLTDQFRSCSWMIKNIEALPEKVNFHHEGKCCVCGRSLTTPESIDRGIGPECMKRF